MIKRVMSRRKRPLFQQWSGLSRALNMIGSKWKLLIVRELGSGPRRFVDLQRELPGISTEQLRVCLNEMVADRLLNRKRYRETPPRVDYWLTGPSEELARIISDLARWGTAHTARKPRRGERVEIGALLREQLGAKASKSLNGTVGILVSRRSYDKRDRFYLLTFKKGKMSLCERVERDKIDLISTTTPTWVRADAYICGTETDWVEAFTADDARDTLQFIGDHEQKESASTLIAAVLQLQGVEITTSDVESRLDARLHLAHSTDRIAA